MGLGAGSWRVFHKLFAENAVLAGLGAIVGYSFAWALLRAFVAVLPGDTFPDEAVISVNTRVLAATMALAAGKALFFGLVPALAGLQRDTNEALKSGDRAHSHFRAGRWQRGLIVCETAIALVLLAGTGVLMRSFLLQREVSPGFNPQHILTAQIFSAKGQSAVEQQPRFRSDLVSSGLKPVLTGVVCGILAALVLLRVLRSEIWGIAANDPPTLGMVGVILLLAGVAGCYLPSLKARRVDPALTRSEVSESNP